MVYRNEEAALSVALHLFISPSVCLSRAYDLPKIRKS